MNSPLAALAWEIWRRGRRSACVALGCIAFCALVNVVAPERFFARGGETLFGFLMVMSFLFTFGIFNYTEFNSSKEWNGFPYRLFALPVRTWQLVTLPMFLGVAWVELVYVAWIKLVWTRDVLPTPEWFGVVLGAYMVFYLTILWSFAGFRIARVLVLGFGGTSSIAVASLPVLGKIFPSVWFSEKRLIPIVVGLGVLAFVAAWAAVERQRHGGGRRRSWVATQWERFADVMPRRTKDFAGPAAAQFWFEWRRTGLLMPACTLFVLAAIFGPVTWIFRHNASFTMNTFPKILATPIVLAFTVGKGFIKPEFWSMNLSLPSFLAVRPLSSGEIVVSKMKVAAVSVAITWILVFVFTALWLGIWADTTKLYWWMDELLRILDLHVWLALIVLIPGALVVFTWRLMVNGLWTGLSGKNTCYFGSLGAQVIVPVLALLAAAIWSDAIDAEVRDHPDVVTSVAVNGIGLILAAVVIGKVWFAAVSWGGISRRRTRRYLAIWTGVTFGFVVLTLLAGPPFDTYRLRHLCLLAALWMFPLARLGMAPDSLAHNRHRL
jgi:hypothetical protein